MFFNQQNRSPKPSLIKTLVNFATIISASITCISLSYQKIISLELAVIVMLIVVIFVALGNNVSKIILACLALILFVLYYSGDRSQYFSILMTQMLTLIIIFIGIYFMIRGIFKHH